jgi:hypothetical protein
VVIGWNESTGNAYSVRDSTGNIYQAATTTVRESNLSQAVYYARNIVGGGRMATP